MKIGEKGWFYIVNSKPRPGCLPSRAGFDTIEEAEAYRDKHEPGCSITLEEHEYGGDLIVERMTIQ